MAVHLLTKCDKLDCKPFLENIQSFLRERKIEYKTEASYGPGGLYKDHFKAAFDDTVCTIIHLCPDILDKVRHFTGQYN
jgi:hypothetical protein